MTSWDIELRRLNVLKLGAAPSLGIRVAMLSLLLIVIGCAPAAPSPAKAAPTKAAEQAPAPATSPVPQPALPPSAARPDSFDVASWEATVAAAKKEGLIVISGQASPAWRQELDAFTQQYGIEVQYTGQNWATMWAKIVQERAVGQYLWDIQMGFLSPEAWMARDRGWLVPIREQLVLPEVIDSSKWLGGLESLYGDRDRRFALTFFSQASASVSVNRDFVPDSEFNSGRQLLEPKWKGRIASLDPLTTGGRGTFVILMEAYGEQFLRDLLQNQDLVPISDMRQMTESVIRGRYPITLAVISDYLVPFHEQGVGLNVERLKEPQGLNFGSGTISLIDQAPHPNAAKLFLNWIVTRDVQTRLAKNLKNNSRRLDVEPGDPESVVDVARLSQYVAIQSEAALPKRDRVGEIAQEILKR